MTLNQPYYIDIRCGKQHLELDGLWDYGYADETLEQPTDILWQYQTAIPKSLYHSLHDSGVLPDPYIGVNSRQYHWVDEKVWYYRKKFCVNAPAFVGNAFLCFDGIAYFSRLWINGILLGEHEGMFGGPVVDVKDYIHLDGENEIVVEVKACNYGRKDDYVIHFDYAQDHAPVHQIVPWALARDSHASGGDFIVMGIWNRVRLEFTAPVHISRPYIYTKSADPSRAELQLEFEIADGVTKELHSDYASQPYNCFYSNRYKFGLPEQRLDTEVTISTKIYEYGTEKLVYASVDHHRLPDVSGPWMEQPYPELTFFRKSIEIDSPKLWYPVGLGEPNLYRVILELYLDDHCCDCHDILTGIRTFTAEPTAGIRYRTNWQNYHFHINGTPFFLMGVNWASIDFLLDIDPEEYRWNLTLAKEAGIQLIRVWNGGGIPESDIFYSLCDELGIMVWQDHMIANNAKAYAYDQSVLHCQESYNIYRIRNHPSLVIHCGGNEFNPYYKDNTAALFVTEHAVRSLDPSRLFYYTSPDGGSAHVYHDMEPAWYRYLYGQLPFLAESGIHSFPDYRSLKALICKEESEGVLPNLVLPEFYENYPELLNHFSEYAPDRVPRMLSRISQIGNPANFTLKDMCEAGQVQAHEYYSWMIQGIRENYPVCGGIMPWVFKRTWTTIGVQLVDGYGRPGYPYYAVKNAYKPLSIGLNANWSVIAPGEEISVAVTLFDQNKEVPRDARIKLCVYNPDLTLSWEREQKILSGKKSYDFGNFLPDGHWRDKCFLICADLISGEDVHSRVTYTIKCTSLLEDPDLYSMHRKVPSENLTFTAGPWLKDCIQKGHPTELCVDFLERGTLDKYQYIDVCIKNSSEAIAFPVTVDVDDDYARFYAEDNFFMMKPCEVRRLRIVCDRIKSEKVPIRVACWNAEPVVVLC